MEPNEKAHTWRWCTFQRDRRLWISNLSAIQWHVCTLSKLKWYDLLQSRVLKMRTIKNIRSSAIAIRIRIVTNAKQLKAHFLFKMVNNRTVVPSFNSNLKCFGDFIPCASRAHTHDTSVPKWSDSRPNRNKWERNSRHLCISRVYFQSHSRFISLARCHLLTTRAIRCNYSELKLFFSFLLPIFHHPFTSEMESSNDTGLPGRCSRAKKILDPIERKCNWKCTQCIREHLTMIVTGVNAFNSSVRSVIVVERDHFRTANLF